VKDLSNRYNKHPSLRLVRDYYYWLLR